MLPTGQPNARVYKMTPEELTESESVHILSFLTRRPVGYLKPVSLRDYLV